MNLIKQKKKTDSLKKRKVWRKNIKIYPLLSN